MSGSTPTLMFDRRRHTNYFVNCLKKLPHQYSVQDTNRLTLVRAELLIRGMKVKFEIHKMMELLTKILLVSSRISIEGISQVLII